MVSKIAWGSESADQYLRNMEDTINTPDYFQTTGARVGDLLSGTEQELMKAYTALGAIDSSAPDYEAKVRLKDAEIQKLNIRYKRLQNLMELFQTIVKSHYEMLQRIINNIPVRN